MKNLKFVLVIFAITILASACGRRYTCPTYVKVDTSTNCDAD